MASSSLPPASCSLMSTRCRCRQKVLKFPHVRSQSIRDEGKSADHIVDAHLSILRKRIDEVKKKDRLNESCRLKSGWNYPPGYHKHTHKGSEVLSVSLEIMSFVSGAVGFVFLSGSLCIFLVSFLVHLTSSRS